MTSAAPPRPDVPAPDFPAPRPSRTPQVLRRLQVVVALALALAGALAAWMVIGLRAEVAASPERAQQYARLAEVRQSLHTASDLAARSVLAAEPSTGGSATRAEDELATAARLLVEAATARPQDAEELGRISEDVQHYGQAVAPAFGAARARAEKLLAAADADLDRALADIGSLQQALADEAPEGPAGNALLVWLPALALLAALVWVSWVVAQRSHRVLNLGLAGAVVGVAVVLGIALGAQGTAASASRASGGEQFTRVMRVTGSVEYLDTAQRNLTAAVVDRTWSDARKADTRQALDSAKTVADDLDLPALKGFDAAVQTVTTSAASGNWAPAEALLTSDSASLHTQGAAFRTEAATLTEVAVTEATTAAGDAQTTLAIQLVALLLFAAAGAVLGVLGLARRLQEYR